LAPLLPSLLAPFLPALSALLAPPLPALLASLDLLERWPGFAKLDRRRGGRLGIPQLWEQQDAPDAEHGDDRENELGRHRDMVMPLDEASIGPRLKLSNPSLIARSVA
jgi:hypothetical protein